MGKFVLIGGGEVGRGNTSYETGTIDQAIVRLSGVSKPNFLFIGIASKFADSYYDTMKFIYRDLGCECNYLKKKNILNNPDIVRNKILSADIIYVGGGDTIKLMSEVREYGIDKLLIEASKKAVIAGISAGAIMLAKKGFSDSLILRGESDEYSFVSGLGLADINICPHYIQNDERSKALFKNVRREKDTIFGIGNCAALIIDGDKKQAVGDEDHKIYKCYVLNDDVVEVEFDEEK